MAERPIGTESALADFASVKSKVDLLRELAKMPDTETIIAAAEPYSDDILPRDRDFLIGLIEALFAFAEASSLRSGADIVAREAFLKKLIDGTIVSDGGVSDEIIPAIRRAIIAEYPEYTGVVGTAVSAPSAPSSTPTPAAVPPTPTPAPRPAPVRLTLQSRPATPVSTPPAPRSAPAPTSAPSAPARPAPANLQKLMEKNTTAAHTANTGHGVAPAEVPAAASVVATASPETISRVLDEHPDFRAFFAKADRAEQLVREQDLAGIETYRRAFAIKDKLATDLYELANGAIEGDFLLDFENPDSHLPKNQRAEFQRYVDTEALERPEQLLNLAFQLETRQVLEKNIATAKAEIERFGGKDLFDTAEQEAMYLKEHLERAHENTRRDSIAGFIPHSLHYGFLKMAYSVGEWLGWKGQTEDQITHEFATKREALLSGRTEDALSVPEKDALAKLQQGEATKLTEFKRHEALGERMVEVAQQGVSRARLKGDGIRLGLGSALTYSPLWLHHPDIARQLDDVNIRLAGIRQRRQTIEQAEQNLATIMQSFEAMRGSVYRELPPTVALVKYAQAQVRNTLTSFTEDTAIEDLQRIYDYAHFLDGNSKTFDTFEAFSDAGELLGEKLETLHEAILAQWGKRVFEIFGKSSLQKKGVIAEMEKGIRDVMGQSTIGGLATELDKKNFMKDLLISTFKKIDPAVGDGKERRLAMVGVMINCGLLKKGENITT